MTRAIHLMSRRFAGSTASLSKCDVCDDSPGARDAVSTVSKKLYKNSRTYDLFMKWLGYESRIDRFLRRLNTSGGPHERILDAGCGTGLLGLHFLERFPAARLQATDLEPNFLHAMLVNAARRGIDRERIAVAQADISRPKQLTTLEGAPLALEDASFDLICIGAVVGYASDIEASLCHLLQLLAPGGTLINIEMSESVTGRFVSRRYQYHNIPLARMRDLIRDQGCQVVSTALGIRHFPANLTRTAIIARKAGG